MGEIEKDGKVLVVRRIHVDYHLKGTTEEQREAAERAHEFHAAYCPVARSIEDSIEITTALEFVD